MAYLNQQDRQNLAQELSQLSFARASGRMRRLDVKSSLTFLRNSQSTSQVFTRYQLPTLGVLVTLVETLNEKALDKPLRSKSVYQMDEVIVEPLPENES